MESGPSEVIERVVGRLIPQASREEVLGDMRERCGTTRAFLGEAWRVVPWVILSRVRRTADPLLLLMEAITAYAAFFAAASLVGKGFLYSEWGLAWLAIPPAAMTLTIMIADAYHHPDRAWRPMLAPALCVATACLVEARWTPRPVMAWGGEAAIMLVALMRTMFAHVADRQNVAKIPAFWLKLDAVSIKDLARSLGFALLAAAAVVCYAVLKRS